MMLHYDLSFEAGNDYSSFVAGTGSSFNEN
jgi:hypothetical protein